MLLIFSLACLVHAEKWVEANFEQSPRVFPSPQGGGSSSWAEAYAKARILVAKLSNEEKSNLTVGFPSKVNGCSGNSGSAEHHGFPGFCLQDGPAGVRGVDMANAYPAGVHMAATWNRELVYATADFMGAEFKRKGAHVALGPVVGPLGRVARGGRNWEGYSPDPYLTGALAAQAVKGLQNSVIASIKHFIGNEQEEHRRPGVFSSFMPAVSSNIDDRTMHELYLWPFQDAVHAGVGSVMCSYQRLNSTYGCENSKSLNGLLKGELGFQGFVVSDWTAQMTGLNSANAGMDMAMPDKGHWPGTTLTDYAKQAYGQVRLNDMATRILAAWYKINMDSPRFPARGTGMPIDVLKPHNLVDARDKASKATRFQAAVEGHVLVKNVDNTLPLVQPKLLSLFGYDGVATLVNNQDPLLNVPGVTLSRWIGGFQALNLTDFQLGLGMIGATPLPNSARRGNLFSGGGSGSGTPSYVDAPFNAIQQRAINDDTYLLWDFQSLNPNVNAASTACLVFINEFATEGVDRPSLADPVSDGLVRNVANKCRSTIVVIHNAGIRLVDAWIDHPNITAVILAHLPGQDSGRALVEIMYGEQSPSGRLPYTLAKKEADYGQLAAPTTTSNLNYNPQSSFTEGVNIDYRWFLSKRIEPQYPLGYGLGYSTFKYSNLHIVQLSSLTPELDTSAFPAQQAVDQGGNPHLWQPMAFIECRLENVGNVKASEVAQLYLQLPGADVETRQLRGFVKKNLAKGVAGLVHFNLTRRDLSIWNVGRQDWEMRRGEYKVFVGSSVLDIKLRGVFSISDVKAGAGAGAEAEALPAPAPAPAPVPAPATLPLPLPIPAPV